MLLKKFEKFEIQKFDIPLWRLKKFRKFEIQKFDKSQGTVLKRFECSIGLPSEIQIYIGFFHFHMKFENSIPLGIRFKKFEKLEIQKFNSFSVLKKFEIRIRNRLSGVSIYLRNP